MKTEEKNLWKWLKGVEQQVKPGALHMERVENTASRGTPDVEGCFQGACFQIELKSVVRAKTIRTGLTKSQAMFLNARWDAGGRAFLLIEVGGDTRYLIPGSQALKFVEPVLEKDLKKANLLLFDTPLEVLETVVCTAPLRV